MKILKEFQHPMRKILIADDSELNARILTEILSIEGYDSEIAPDGDSAVSIFASSEPGEFSFPSCEGGFYLNLGQAESLTGEI